MKRRPLLGGVALVVVAGLVGAAFTLGQNFKSPQQAAAEAAPPRASKILVPVESRVLGEQLVFRGKVMPGPSVGLMPPLGATGPDSVITAVKISEGQRLDEGSTVAVRSGEPMFAFVLPFPLYRDLKSGDRGPDVVEVQKALRRIGFSTPTSSVWDSAAQNALRRFYTARGYSVPQSISQPQGAGELPMPSAAASSPMLARAAIVRLDQPGRKVTKTKVKVGDVLTAADSPLAELDGGRTFIATTVLPEQVKLFSVGQQAAVLDELSNTTTEVAVASIASEIALDAATGATGFAVTFAFSSEAVLPASDRSVRIMLPQAKTAGKVLAVPITAVYSAADGSTFVTVSQTDGSLRDITVKTGQIAGGWVELTPVAGVQAGSLVVAGASQTPFEQP